MPAAPVFRQVRVLHVDAPALVLGSTQPDTVVAPGIPERMAVVRRSSGGGAVLLEPGRVLWVDVVIPANDARWSGDVGRAFWWLGDLWASALAPGLADLVVHRAGLVRSEWSSLICFAGLGPGEITVGAGGPKVLGMAQRRTRDGALFQCAVPMAWDAASTVDLLALSAADRDRATLELRDAVAPVTSMSADEAVAAFLRALPDD